MVVDMKYFVRVIRKLIPLILSIVAIYLGFQLAVFYLPFLIAFILSILIEPAIRFFMKKTHLKRKTSSIIVFLIVLSILIGLITWAIMSLVSEASNLLVNLNQYFEKGSDFINNLMAKIDLSRFQLSNTVVQTLQKAANDTLDQVSTWAKNILIRTIDQASQIPSILICVVISFLALYFMCTDKVYMIDQLEHHLPKLWVKKLGIHIKAISKSLGGYLKAECILIFISFIISIIGLYLFKIMGFGVRYPLLAALGIGFVDALPIFGSGTVMLPWAVISAFDGNLSLAIAIFVLWVIMSIVRQLLEPKLVSKHIGIHPIFTLIAMYTGFKFIGIMGLLLGPIVLIILKNIYATLLEQGVAKAIFER